jgi:hypothetical protein
MAESFQIQIEYVTAMESCSADDKLHVTSKVLKFA